MRISRLGSGQTRARDHGTAPRRHGLYALRGPRTHRLAGERLLRGEQIVATATSSDNRDAGDSSSARLRSLQPPAATFPKSPNSKPGTHHSNHEPTPQDRRRPARATAPLRYAHRRGKTPRVAARSARRRREIRRFPELAFTTFFPRWWVEDQAEVDALLRAADAFAETQPLFDEAKKLGIGFYIYAEARRGTGRIRRFNTAILVTPETSPASTQGAARPRRSQPQAAFQHLEKKY